jgi:hypothetical protein
MGSWYRVVKTIKGHRYLYEQRTWREGKHVRTQSRYVGRAGEGSTVRADRAAAYQTLTIPPDLQARSVASTAEPREAVSRRSAPQTPLRDIYSQVTDRILADLEKGVRPWDRPWSVRAPTRPLRHNGEPYRGINIILLWLSAAEHGFSSPHWMTFRQAQELGGHVRKGEKGTWIAYASTIIRAMKDATGKPVLDDEGKEMTEDVHFLKGIRFSTWSRLKDCPISTDNRLQRHWIHQSGSHMPTSS